MKGQLATEEEINQRKQKEVDALKKEIEGLRIEKQNARKDLSRAKAMYEGMVQYQQNAMYNQPLPTMQLNEINSGNQQKADQGEFNEKLIRTLGLIRWQGEEPAWYKLQFLERAKKINPNDREALRQEYTRLLIGKKELSERLNKVEGVLKISAEHEKKKEEDHLLLKKKKENELMRLEETRKDLESTLDRVGVGAGKVFIGKNQRTGQDIFYNDGISVFSMDQSDMFRINMEENLLDIYLDKLDLEPEMVISALEAVQVAGVYPQNLVSIMAVNFFNHPTLTSQKCFGTQAEIKLQSTFAFRCDGFFIEYCKKNTLDVDVFFTNEHGALVKFAIAQLDLNKLIEVNMADKRDDYIGVVNTFARVYTLGHQHIGILTFRMKTRLPIYRDLLAYNSMHRGATGGPHTTYDSKHLNTERYLNIKVCNGYGFSTYAKTFVTYRFMSTGETVSKAVEGANPRFDEVRQFPLMYTQGVSEYLKNEVVEFTVMDDSIPFRQPGSEGLRDVIGSGMYVYDI